MADLIGKTLLSQFRVDSFVAAGGMGAVYRVWDLKRNVPLAMKVLHSELADDPSMFKHFQREGRALQKLAHPNIVPFYGLYQSMDFAFMLERFVDGPSLKDVLKRGKGKPLPLEDTLIYMRALCAALGYAHANGVVHCDVKPGNIMMDGGGGIYLADFGIARHAESSTTTMGAAGTSAYMPPEQILGEVVTPATDVYAIGVILYEMVTGRRPFRGGDPATDPGVTLNVRIRQEQLHSQPQDPRELAPGIPEKLSQAILAALSKKPEDRFASAPQFFEAVCKAVDISPSSVNERIVLPEFRENRDYTTGQEVIKGAAPVLPPQPRSSRSPAVVGGIVVSGILGLIVIVAVGAFTFLGGNGLAGLLPSQTPLPTHTSQPTHTSLPTQTRLPTYTPYPTLKPTSTPAPTKRPRSTSTTAPKAQKPTLYLTKNCFCRTGPGGSYPDVTSFTAGERFPILAWNPQGWWLVEVNVPGSKHKSCWIWGNTPEGNYSSVDIIE